MNIISITNSDQLPRWLLEPLPRETVEQAAARVRAAYGVERVTVYVLAGRAFIQHPRAEMK